MSRIGYFIYDFITFISIQIFTLRLTQRVTILHTLQIERDAGLRK